MDEINGKSIHSIEGLMEDSERVVITFTDGSKLIQSHDQDCCESVLVSQVDGDINKYIGSTVNGILVKEDTGDTAWGTYTATFYTLVTNKGYLDWRWQGESNGYYSENVRMSFVWSSDDN